MICKWCGEEVENAEGGCPNCGRDLSPQTEEGEIVRLARMAAMEQQTTGTLPFELTTEPVPEVPVEEEEDELDSPGLVERLKESLHRPIVPIVAAGLLLLALLIAVVLLIRANSLLQKAQRELEVLREQISASVPASTTEPTVPDTEETATQAPVTTEAATESSETTAATEDPEALLEEAREQLHEQLLKQETHLTMTFADGAWTIEGDPDTLQEDLTAAWDQLPLARMDGYYFGRLYIHSELLAGTENEELVQLWMGYQTVGSVINLNTELDVKNDAGFGERAQNGSDYRWYVRADSTEDWVELRVTGGGRMAELHPRVSDPELRLVCKRKNTSGGQIILEILGMHLSDLKAPKRTVVN